MSGRHWQSTEARNDARKANYAQTRAYAKNARVRWGQEEDRAIMAPDRPSDRELAIKLGRSVQAIQIRRTRIAP